MSVSVGTDEQRIETFYLSNKQKQVLKYLNSKRIKTHRRPCCAGLCRSLYAHGFTAGQKTVENQDWATGPRSRGAAGSPGRGGPRAAGRWAVGRGPAFSKTLDWSSNSEKADLLLLENN